MHRSLSPLPRRRSLLAGAALFVLLALGVHMVMTARRNQAEQELREAVRADVSLASSRLQADLNANLFLARGLMATVTGIRDIENREIQTTLKTFFGLGRHVRNIAFAPGNRITHVYPLAGNEGAIGLYYPDNAEQWLAIERAIAQRRTILAGPVRLRQGGMGLISRTPVFFDDNHYWGLLSVVIETTPLFRAAGISAENRDLLYAVRGKDGLGERGDCILGDCTLFAEGALVEQLEVPGGSWQIAALPKGGWQRQRGMLDLIEGIGVLVSLLLALTAVAYLRGRQRIESNERRLRAVLATANDAVIVINQQGRVEEFNPAAERLFGYGTDEILGTPLTRLMSEEDGERHDSYVAAAEYMQPHLMARGREIHGRHRDGSLFPVEVTIGRTLIEGRTVFVGVLRDITERKAMERRLTELATHDSLTGVENRHAIMTALEQAVSQAERYLRPLSVLMIDADHFKNINDRHGHQVGDQVLIHLTAALTGCLRQSDRLGRIGGEEFIAVLPETGGERATQVAERLRAAVAESVLPLPGGQELRFTVSIGIAASADGCTRAAHLLEEADRALYAAKAAGRNCCRSAPTQ